MWKIWKRKVIKEDLPARYEYFEDRIFRLTGWTIGIATLVVTVAIGFSITQVVISNNTLNQLKKADTNNKLLANIALAATPNSRIDATTEAIKIDPENAQLYYYRAITYFQITTNTANSIRFDYFSPDEELRNLYKHSIQFEAAFEDCNEAIFLDKDYADAYYLQGQIKYLQEDYETAYNCFKKCMKLERLLSAVDLNNWEFNSQMGKTCYCLEKYDEAIEYLKEALNMPLSAEATTVNIENTVCYMLAEAYNNTNNLPQAAYYFDKSLYTSYVNESSNLCQRLIDIYDKLGNTNQKEKYMKIKKYIDEHKGEKPQPYGQGVVE